MSISPSGVFCPRCKKHVHFEKAGRRRRCPECGFEYELSDAREDSGPGVMEAAVSVLGVLGRVLLIMVAIVIVAVGVLFAGCALMLGGMH